MKRSHRAYDATKRVLDVIIAGTALLVLCPVLAVVALIVRANLGAPVIFMQRRPGRHGKSFTVHKFRTMAPMAAGTRDVDAVASDSGRLTRLGRMLRSTSLDELPEFWDVLVGNMSIVGPRPLLMEYLDRYNEEQARRHEVRPGITGWAQVNGRNATSWEERFAMDVWYVDHRSLLLDARIIGRTIGAVFSRRGIAAPGTDTMVPFDPDAEPTSAEEAS